MTGRALTLSDTTITKLIRVSAGALVVGTLAIVALRVLDRPNHGPTLFDREIDAAREVLKSAPDAIGPRLQLAHVYRSAGRHQEALEQYDEILKVEASEKTALLGRADILLEDGDLGGASKAYGKVIATTRGGEFSPVDPQREHAYYGLASVALAQGRARDAVAAASSALKIDATDADAWYLLGTSNLAAGDPRAAVEGLRRAVLFVPTGWCEPYADLGTAYGHLGQRARASYANAMLDFCQQRPERAVQTLERLTSGPAAVDAMLGLAMIAESTSDRTAAVRWYHKVVAADPSNFNARAGLTRLGVPPAAQKPAKPAPRAQTDTDGGTS